MEYRIKIIEKYSGEKKYIPQFRNSDWSIKLCIGIMFFPIWLAIALAGGQVGIAIFCFFFYSWEEIEYDKSTFREIHTFFQGNGIIATCDNWKDAEEVIKVHRKNHEEESYRTEQEKINRKAEKTKKQTYIKYIP